MGTTAKYALPYPETTASVDVPRDVKALAEAVDAMEGLVWSVFDMANSGVQINNGANANPTWTHLRSSARVPWSVRGGDAKTLDCAIGGSYAYIWRGYHQFFAAVTGVLKLRMEFSATTTVDYEFPGSAAPAASFVDASAVYLTAPSTLVCRITNSSGANVTSWYGRLVLVRLGP